jgi:hypothetical protein
MEGRFIVVRSLKIQEVGDFYRKKTKPTLILSGKWLKEAGFLPNTRVQVTSNKCGELVITLEKIEIQI